MTLISIRKLLRDVRVPLLAVVLLLVLFQALWVKITERISAELMPMLLWLGQGRNISGVEIEQTLFKGPGKITKTIKPKKQGIVTFRPLATKSCKVPRVGITGVFTPPVTG